MPPRSRITREAILAAATRIISETGGASMTFQTLGDTLGVSKQAIIYWFPSKADLMRELILPALQLEAEAMIGALQRVKTARKGIEAFLRALIAFHRADLGRFRLLYAASQFDTEIWKALELPRITDAIHATTGQMYGALERVLASAPDAARPSAARVTAVAVHMAGIGFLSMLSLAEATHDPLAHATEALLDALVMVTTGQHVRNGS